MVIDNKAMLREVLYICIYWYSFATDVIRWKSIDFQMLNHGLRGHHSISRGEGGGAGALQFFLKNWDLIFLKDKL